VYNDKNVDDAREVDAVWLDRAIATSPVVVI